MHCVIRAARLPTTKRAVKFTRTVQSMMQHQAKVRISPLCRHQQDLSLLIALKQTGPQRGHLFPQGSYSSFFGLLNLLQ